MEKLDKAVLKILRKTWKELSQKDTTSKYGKISHDIAVLIQRIEEQKDINKS